MRKIFVFILVLFLQNFLFSLSPKSSFNSDETFMEYLQKNGIYFQGNQYSCFQFSELPLILKILKTKGSEEDDFLKPLHLIIERVPLEKLVNGEVFPKTIAVKINENGITAANEDVEPEALLQERVMPVNQFLTSELEASRMTLGEERAMHIRGIKNVLGGFKKTLEQMALYGIVDTDPVQAFPNYGVTDDGRVVCFDFSHLKPVEEASAFHVLRLLRKALNEFDSCAGAGSPAFRVPVEIYREISDFMLLDAKYYESSVLNAEIKVNLRQDALMSYYQIIQEDPFISQVNLLYEKALQFKKAA